MKRSQMKRKLTNLLKNWEGSKLDGETSEAILKLIEDAGMVPPEMFPRPGYKNLTPVHEWEPED